MNSDKRSVLYDEYRELFDFIYEGKVQVGYDEILREFYIELETKPIVQTIYFCPWTGKKLPKSVSDEYFSILDEPGVSDTERKQRKASMNDETWWINRGLK